MSLQGFKYNYQVPVGTRVVYVGLSLDYNVPEDIGKTGIVVEKSLDQFSERSRLTAVLWDKKGNTQIVYTANLGPLEFEYVPSQEGDKDDDI